jgi:hypothetical protein
MKSIFDLDNPYPNGSAPAPYVEPTPVSLTVQWLRIVALLLFAILALGGTYLYFRSPQQWPSQVHCTADSRAADCAAQ